MDDRSKTCPTIKSYTKTFFCTVCCVDNGFTVFKAYRVTNTHCVFDQYFASCTVSWTECNERTCMKVIFIFHYSLRTGTSESEWMEQRTRHSRCNISRGAEVGRTRRRHEHRLTTCSWKPVSGSLSRA